MVSFEVKAFNEEKAFLAIKLDSNEFAVSVEQIDGIGEFNKEFQERTKSELYLGNYSNQARIIPIINLKKYLQCPKSVFISTVQSRILFLSSSEVVSLSSDVMTVGLGIDAIIGFYRVVTSGGEMNKENLISSELKCFQINSYIEINSKIHPILNLKKLLDFYQLKNILEDYLPEKI